MKFSLRTKTIFGTAIIEAVLLVALVISAVMFMTKTANENLVKRADTTSRLFATMSKDAVLSYDLAALDAFVNEVMNNPDIKYARVLDANGQVFAVAGENASLGREFVADTELAMVTDKIFDSYALVVEDEQIYGRVEIGIGIGAIQQSLAYIQRWMTILAITEMFMVALFSFLLGNYLTNQLSKLKESAASVKKAIGTGDFSDSKVEIVGHDEVSQVALNFNLLVDKLSDQSKQTKIYQQELEQFNQTLEQKINDRTAEVVGKNKQLQQVNLHLQEAQQQLVQSEKLASMGQLAAGLAHEVNNPISFVSSNLETLARYSKLYNQLLLMTQQAIATEDETLKNKIQTDIQDLIQDQDMHFVSEDMALLLDDMEEGLQRVTDIVQNMSVFSRVDGDVKQLFNINDCIRSTYKMVKKQVREKADLSLDLQDLPDVPMNVGKINQVIMNLIMNAAQAMTERGSIKVFSKRKDNNIQVFISDTGCGIPEAALDKIFDPFYTTKKEGEGTGLGLAISYDIVVEHGGELKVSSKENKGTVFTLSLPIKTAVIH